MRIRVYVYILPDRPAQPPNPQSHLHRRKGDPLFFFSSSPSRLGPFTWLIINQKIPASRRKEKKKAKIRKEKEKRKNTPNKNKVNKKVKKKKS